jgi:hypothetical protein
MYKIVRILKESLYRLYKYQFKSILIFVLISVVYIFKKRLIIKSINKEYKIVHLICPGPTAEKFYSHKVGEEEAVIFINHAVLMSGKVSREYKKYYFSADGSRTNEIIENYFEELKNCTSVLASTHLFHFNLNTIRNIDLILLPHIEYSKKFGLEGVVLGPQNFRKIKERYYGYGFGSLNSSLQLAVAFNPKIISIWGCDLGEQNGVRYFDSKVPVRPTEAFDIAKSHFQIIKQKILAHNIIMERNGEIIKYN